GLQGMKRFRTGIVSACVLALSGATASGWAAPGDIGRDGMEYAAPGIAAAAADKSVVVQGTRIPYRVSWSEYVLKDEQGAAQATLSSIGYERSDVADRQRRPVVFAFNGGPGASSTPLHFSGFGPKRRVGTAGGAQDLVDNQESLIDVADLVFIDPVGTGFSRMANEAGKRYLGVVADGEAVARYMRDWLARHGREDAPVVVMGESYGGIRLG